MTERLLAEARAQRSLIRRRVRPEPTPDVRRYLEEVVSIAVTSAQQAEVLAAQAREAAAAISVRLGGAAA